MRRQACVWVTVLVVMVSGLVATSQWWHVHAWWGPVAVTTSGNEVFLFWCNESHFAMQVLPAEVGERRTFLELARNSTVGRRSLQAKGVWVPWAGMLLGCVAAVVGTRWWGSGGKVGSGFPVAGR